MEKSFFKILCSVLIILVCGPYCTKTGNSDESGNTDALAKYIAGFSLLTTKKNSLKDSVGLRRFRELEEITGLHPDSVRTLLASLRDRPEKGKELYQKMNRLYQSQTDTVNR